MEEQFDTQLMVERAGEVMRELRQSEAFPAIIGGIAGGIAGALMAAIIASRAAPREAEPARATKTARAGWNPGEIAQLLTVVMGLAKQVQTFLKEQKK